MAPVPGLGARPQGLVILPGPAVESRARGPGITPLDGSLVYSSYGLWQAYGERQDLTIPDVDKLVKPGHYTFF